MPFLNAGDTLAEMLKAILLGIIQGLTEFLPVSSSGHLELGQYFLDYQFEEALLFSVVVHFATALSTIVVFRKDVLEIIRGLFRFQWNDETKFVALVVVSMVPATFIGLFFEEQLDALFSGNIVMVSLLLYGTALLLILADRAKVTDKPVGWFDAVLIGLAQAVAILPGISRSGATITASVLLGIDRYKAARFSFLMVVPLILGKMSKDLLSGKVDYTDSSFIPLLLAFIAAFITGVFACNLMINLVRRARLWYFSVYCVVVATVALLLYLW